ncbi:MAG: metal-sensitive transcriptional regulator [Chloroflexi bacterium]|nr:metal-sensitive transcriptional regulator [Chloroflexota bacterium]MDA8188016.1 metal-sensitive transcriptional regulator [Dehalococcoidales bacterium]
MANSLRQTRTYRCHDEKELLLSRMRKIEGQARGIARMIEDNRYCVDIVQQLNALSSAADEVALRILEDHIKGCVTDAIREERGDDAVEELLGVIRKAIHR